MLAFPANPQINDTYTASGKTWKWTGVVWQLQPRTLTSADITDFNTAVGNAAPPTTNASLLTSGTLADARLSANVVLTGDARLSNARTPTAHAASHATGGSDPITPAAIGAATAAQGAKADTALQPGTAISSISGLQTALDGKATSAQGSKADSALQPGAAISAISGLQTALDGKQAAGSYATLVGGVVPASQLPASGANFQPNPEFSADNVANAVVSGGAMSFGGAFLKETQWFGTFYNYGGFYGSGGTALVFNGTTFLQSSVANRWALIGDEGEGGYTAYAIADQTGGAYPWSVTYNNGYVVTKTQSPRLVGTQLATTATEGTSAYAARADHVHPLPTALQVGAAPIQGGKIPAQYLPSYVDDVVEFASLAALQSDTSARESGKIYVTRDTGKIYRWSGSAYIEISQTLELEDLQIPDIRADISAFAGGMGGNLSVIGVLNGKNSYTWSGNNGYSYQVFWTGTQWKGVFEYNGDGTDYQETISTSNTTYPWQATGWTNGGSVTRVGTYNAVLAPAPLAADAYSGIGTKAAREDHVHPLPTAAQLGAATVAQLDTKQTKTVYGDTAPAHAAGLEWVDTTELRAYRSYNNAWVEIDRA